MTETETPGFTAMRLRLEAECGETMRVLLRRWPALPPGLLLLFDRAAGGALAFVATIESELLGPPGDEELDALRTAIRERYLRDVGRPHLRAKGGEQ